MNLSQFQTISDSWWPVIISLAISLIGAIRFYMAGPKCPSEERIDGKIVLITGASSGLGLATAKGLAQRGGKIILTCRSMSKGSEAVKQILTDVPDARIDVRILDVSSLTNIRDFCARLQRDYVKLDILINNAGIIFNQYERTPEGMEMTFVTNYLGPFLLTHLLLPQLSKSPIGRIINLSAMAHSAAKFDIDNLNSVKSFVYREAYGETKLYLVMFTNYLSQKLKNSNVTVNAVSPGLVRNTNHMAKSPLASSWMTKLSVYPWTWLFLKTPTQGAQTIIYAAVDSGLAHQSGLYLSDCDVREPSDLAKDRILLEKLYNKSAELCRLDTEKTFTNLAQSTSLI